MLPSELKPEQFSAYPPQAKSLVTQNLAVLRELPLSFLPGLLREAIEFDFKFPAERKTLENEIGYLARLSPEQRRQWFDRFSTITISPKLEHFDWVNSPAQFVEQLSAHLWTTHQLDAFRISATRYADHLNAVVAADGPPIPRLGISIIGQGVGSFDGTLFRKLRPYGTFFSRIKPENGLGLLLEAVAERAKRHP